MAESLLFLPDISGFTDFVQSTEVEHSQHVIAELLEILAGANTQNLQLAEVEGDALFFYKEEEIPSAEKLLAQVETMFTAFYSHMKLLEKNRVCPCNACATAPNLQLKIIAHSGEIQFITVQDKRKPFGQEVIEVHRLMKNSVNSNNYVLFSKALTQHIMLPENYNSKLFQFQLGKDKYDNRVVEYSYSEIINDLLKIDPFPYSKKVDLVQDPTLHIQKEFPLSAKALLEYISNYNYRHFWVDGVERFEFNENEVTRLGSEHVCVINGQHFNFVTVTKSGKSGQLIYGELTTDPPPVDEMYQFYILTPLGNDSCNLEVELYVFNKSIIRKLIFALVAKRVLKKSVTQAMDKLHEFVSAKNKEIHS